MFPWTTLCDIIHNYAKKTTIELSDEQYFFLKEKALALQKQNKNASIVSIIRDLVEKDRDNWINKGKKK